jgi:hypothetical protein
LHKSTIPSDRDLLLDSVDLDTVSESDLLPRSGSDGSSGEKSGTSENRHCGWYYGDVGVHCG